MSTSYVPFSFGSLEKLVTVSGNSVRVNADLVVADEDCALSVAKEDYEIIIAVTDHGDLFLVFSDYLAYFIYSVSNLWSINSPVKKILNQVGGVLAI